MEARTTSAAGSTAYPEEPATDTAVVEVDVPLQEAAVDGAPYEGA
jgi:hypothetical protein